MVHSLKKPKLSAFSRSVKDEIADKSRSRRRTQTVLSEIEGRVGGTSTQRSVPNCNLKYLPIADLKDVSRPFRVRGPAQAAMIKGSLATHGISKPIVVNADS